MEVAALTCEMSIKEDRLTISTEAQDAVLVKTFFPSGFDAEVRHLKGLVLVLMS